MSPTARSNALLAHVLTRWEPAPEDTTGKPAGDVGAGKGEDTFNDLIHEWAYDEHGRPELIRVIDITNPEQEGTST